MNNVLIIEDEYDTAKPVQEALRLRKVDADIAQDGKEGLERFREGQYDLVLLDLKMPGMDGETVLEEIRRIDPFVDVIIYTNYEDFADTKRLVNIGIEGYINKGAKADLSELIQAILKRLAPLEEEEVEKMIQHTPEEMFEES